MMLLLSLWLRVGQVLAVPPLVDLRHLYAEAVQQESAQQRFRAALHAYKGQQAAVLAYKAAAEAVQARYEWSPLAKLRAVRTAQALFTRAVTADPANVEVRFLRYTIESNVPAYLGFSHHLATDRAAIMRGVRHYPDLGLDAQSLRLIRDFMLTRGHCSAEEAQMLRAVQP